MLHSHDKYWQFVSVGFWCSDMAEMWTHLHIVWVAVAILMLVSRWVSESVSQWVSESVSRWVSEPVSQWASESVSQSVSQSESVSQWVSESASQRVSESASQWVSESVSQGDIGFKSVDSLISQWSSTIKPPSICTVLSCPKSYSPHSSQYHPLGHKKQTKDLKKLPGHSKT